MTTIKIQWCPKCKQVYEGYPSISRIDNKTKICSDCGTEEALDIFIKRNQNKVEAKQC